MDRQLQSVVYIPYQGSGKSNNPHLAQLPTSSWKFTEDDDDDELNPPPYTPYRPFQERDLPNGYELRMKTYRAAWTKCLDMVQVRLFILPVLTGHPKC